MTQLVCTFSPRMTETGPSNPVLSDLLGAIQALNDEVAQLRHALGSRAVIDRAKGMLMLRYQIDAHAAFALLTRLSRGSNVEMRLIAESVVANGHADQRVDGPEPIAAQGCQRLNARPRRHSGLLR